MQEVTLPAWPFTNDSRFFLFGAWVFQGFLHDFWNLECQTEKTFTRSRKDVDKVHIAGLGA